MRSTKSISRIISGFLAAFAILFIASCRDEEADTLSDQEEQAIAEYSTLADNSIDEELLVIEDIELATSPNGRSNESCVVVTRDTAAKTVTLDFGTGCVGRFGRERSGKVIINYGGTFGDQLANRVITFEDYFVDNKEIQGQIELRNFNRNGEGQLTAERKVTGYTVIFPDGNTFELNGTVTRTLISGGEDGVRGNEVIEITGSWEGTSTRNRTITRTITEPIISDFSCRTSGGFLRVAGQEEMTIANTAVTRTRVINYGDGTCDNEFSITVNGRTFTIAAE